MTKKKLALVTIVGKPNAGKSTLLNHLIGQKLAIVTPKVQTTRSSVTGILSVNNTQLVFVDTPGIFKAKTSFERAMVRCAWSNIVGADNVIFLIDSKKDFDDESIEILSKLKQHNIKPILAINKIDHIKSKKDKIIKQLEEFKDDINIFEISALHGDNIEKLMQFLTDNAQEKEWLYDEDALTNLPERFIASEITREQLFLQMQQELPYKLTVESENWEVLKDGSVKISQVIIVSRQNYKAMILGNKGERIKKIGTKAREEISKALGIKPHLFLFVKVREDWDTNPLNYKYLGLKWKK